MADSPQNYAWAWFKPPHLPYGLILRIPDETYRTCPELAATWTLRRLLQAAAVDPSGVVSWVLYGVVCHGLNGTSPYLDAPIAPPVPGIDPNISVYMAVPANGPAGHLGGAPVAQATAVPSNGDLAEAFERMEADWEASVELEREMGRLRKQLLDLMTRLKTLNRDLGPQERLHSDSQDKKDWLEARRGLRDGALRLWKCVKTHDIGDTSAAGQKRWFEQIYQQQVLPRQMFEGLSQAQRAFETYRKKMQTLYNEMNSAYSVASLDGERKAVQVMARIAQKVRDATKRKNFLGVILD